MYRDSYVAALMVDGKIQKESDDGSVLIPFGSEYVLRLKNKLRKRAVADVWIDGKIAVKGIVIDANGTVDLERFVADGNLNEGKRFKLARLTDPKVDQPNDSENGSIEVNFYPEKDEPEIEKKIIHITDNHHYCSHNHFGHCSSCCTNPWCSVCHPHYFKTYCGDVTWGTTTGGLSSSTGNLTVGSNSVNAVFTALGQTASVTPDVGMPMNMATGSLDSKSISASNALGEAAATVEGSTSNQKFSSIYIDVDRSKPTTIRLIVKGLSKLINVCQCGYRRKKDVKFCPNDGNELVA
jgi:hypothetical protein